jgi:hypothetical protein
MLSPKIKANTKRHSKRISYNVKYFLVYESELNDNFGTPSPIKITKEAYIEQFDTILNHLFIMNARS